jgi:hypothetical protein
MASCSIPGWYSPISIGGRRYVDGGACSPTSLDLVAPLELDEVVVLSPMTSLEYDRPATVAGRLERRFRRVVTKRLMGEVKKVAATGTTVTLLSPGAEDLAVIGANLMDPRRRVEVLETSMRTSAAALRVCRRGLETGRMRVYLPLILSGLRTLLDTGEVGEPPLPGYAVTGALREWYAEGDEEALEYAALTLAARASIRLLDRALLLEPDLAPRRVVVVAEVDAAEPAPDVDRAAVRVLASVPLRRVQAVHVDGAEAEADVRAAAEALVEADLGSEDAAFVVEQADGHELQWFATQEIGPLLELL